MNREEVCKQVSEFSLEQQQKVTKFIGYTCPYFTKNNISIATEGLDYIITSLNDVSMTANAKWTLFCIMKKDNGWHCRTADLDLCGDSTFETNFAALQELEKNGYLLRRHIDVPENDEYFINPCYLIQNMEDDEFNAFILTNWKQAIL